MTLTRDRREVLRQLCREATSGETSSGWLGDVVRRFNARTELAIHGAPELLAEVDRLEAQQVERSALQARIDQQTEEVAWLEAALRRAQAEVATQSARLAQLEIEVDHRKHLVCAACDGRRERLHGDGAMHRCTVCGGSGEGPTACMRIGDLESEVASLQARLRAAGIDHRTVRRDPRPRRGSRH